MFVSQLFLFFMLSVESHNIASVQFSSNMSHYREEKGDT